MIDHITFGVTDYERSIGFYDAAFRPLGITRVYDLAPEESGGVRGAGYGIERPQLWLAEHEPTRGKFHIALAAETRAIVDAFHKAALAAGGKDNGAPGLRPHYHPNYYGAFVLDPDGHNIEAVCHQAE